MLRFPRPKNRRVKGEKKSRLLAGRGAGFVTGCRPVKQRVMGTRTSGSRVFSPTQIPTPSRVEPITRGKRGRNEITFRSLREHFFLTASFVEEPLRCRRKGNLRGTGGGGESARTTPPKIKRNVYYREDLCSKRARGGPGGNWRECRMSAKGHRMCAAIQVGTKWEPREKPAACFGLLKARRCVELMDGGRKPDEKKTT